jgi:hypothetical protein
MTMTSRHQKPVFVCDQCGIEFLDPVAEHGPVAAWHAAEERGWTREFLDHWCQDCSIKRKMLLDDDYAERAEWKNRV